MIAQALIFAGSLAGIAVLVFFARWLGLGGDPVIAGDQEARELAADAVSGFEALHIGRDAGGRAALLSDGTNRIMLIVPHGVHFAARLLEKGSTSARDGAELTVRSFDPTFPVAKLDLGEAAGAWDMRIKALDS